MAETVKEAVMFIEQGHVRVGVETITDPAFHVNRNMEDHVTWVKQSSIRKKIMKYNNEYDDIELIEWKLYILIKNNSAIVIIMKIFIRLW